jgi:hypothetical protein
MGTHKGTEASGRRYLSGEDRLDPRRTQTLKEFPQFLPADRLDEILDRARLKEFLGGIEGPVGAHQGEGDPGVELYDPEEKIFPRAFGKAQIAEDKLGLIAEDLFL